MRSARFLGRKPTKNSFIIETILKNKELLNHTRAGISFVREEQKDAAQKIADNILKYLNKT